MGILRDGSTLHKCLFWNVRYRGGKIVGLKGKKPWEPRNKVSIIKKGVVAVGEDRGLAWSFSGYFCLPAECVMPWNLPGNKMWCMAIWKMLYNFLWMHIILFIYIYIQTLSCRLVLVFCYEHHLVCNFDTIFLQTWNKKKYFQDIDLSGFSKILVIIKILLKFITRS